MDNSSAGAQDGVLDAQGRVACDLKCAHCGHSLYTQPGDGPCPGCDRPIGETVAPYLPALDQTGRIGADLPCVNCGYNLRMQPVTGVCPECAAHVARSARGHYLNQAQPHWVRGLANGATLLLVTISAMIVMYIVFIGLSISLGIAGGPGSAANSIMTAVSIFGGMAATACLILAVIGLIRLTRRDPAEVGRPEGFTSRKATRWCLLTVPVAIGLGILFSVTLSGGFGSRILTPLIQIPMVIIGTVAYVVLPLAALRHIANLMRRTPRRGLVTFAMIEFWGLLVCGIVYVVTTTIFMFTFMSALTPVLGGPNAPTLGPNSPFAVNATASAPVYSYDPNGVVTTTTMPPPAAPTFGPAFMVSSVFMGIGGCGMFVLSIAGFILLILVRNALTAEAKQAEGITASAVATP